jgi:hypothetical protein
MTASISRPILGCLTRSVSRGCARPFVCYEMERESAVRHRPRPVKWCARVSAPSSRDVQAAASIAITSSGSSTGSASAFAIDSALM